MWWYVVGGIDGTPWACCLVGDMACMPQSLLVVNKGCWQWWVLVVDECFGWWSPWLTMVMWHHWVGVTDDGGGWGRRLFGLLMMPNQMLVFADACLGR